MEFLDCWTELALPDLLRLLAPAVFLATAALLPGVRVVRLAAIGVALTIPLVEELGVTPRFTVAWSALWLLIAWATRGQEGAARRPLAARHGVLEASTVGLLLGVALTTLLIGLSRLFLGVHFPHDVAIGWLVGAMLLEQNDEWSLNRRYMQLEGLQTITDTAPTRLPAVQR